MKITKLHHWLGVLALLGIAPLGAVGQVKTAAHKPAAHKPAAARLAASIVNPVLAGDYPDPSVTKIGNTYWATATSSNWGPTFPLLKSTNLTDWTLVGHVFPGERPAWADYYFWAPEISQDGGKTYIYYTAHRRGGNLSVGVAPTGRGPRFLDPRASCPTASSDRRHVGRPG